MKAAWAVGAAAIVSVPILALPTQWPRDSGPRVTRYRVGEHSSSGSQVIIACPARKGANISVSIDGIMAPPNSSIGFSAAHRTVAMRSGEHGDIETRSRKNAAAFRTLWHSIRMGGALDISFADGATARLPLTDISRTLPEAPCPVDYRPAGLELALR